MTRIARRLPIASGRPLAILVTMVFVLGACTQSTATEDSLATDAPNEEVAATTSISSTDPTSETTASAPSFTPLNQAEGFGFLRLMTLEERPNPLDVVVYETLPNELPRVAGVITAVPQTPLSHVNLRALQDNVPNAYVQDALADPSIIEFVGRYVRYTVTESGFIIESATQDEVEAHHAAARPTVTQQPERDLAVTAIAPLAEIGFDDWIAFGVKTANLAVLRSLDLPDAAIPDGFGVPFSFYDDFMEENGFYEQVESMLADPDFSSDPVVQDQRLEELREAIKDAPMSPSAMTALASLQESFPVETSLRCRSSTNNEDLPNFSGAGLYDSKTQHPDEGHMSKCIKQVYASVWNLRAFLERDFYRIDHLSTAMGVLIHPNFEDEQSNGVAVSFDPVYDTPDVYYINAQRGEDLVTNPEAWSVPESLLLWSDGSVAFITHSNLIEPGEQLLSDSQLAGLQASLAVIHDEFAVLYGAEDRGQFAMEIEFKITSESVLAIKQARTWLFVS